ncbi:alpha-amylase family glycosyl hydrolase [Bifidobacterium angulatum]|uniref:alpha-amylase family glycosyl hydrolase n=1 Tax=Bifidobacterium angulatum TaxID=1683 RepID=UPI003D2C5ACE
MVRYYLIEFADGSVTRSADPWARAAGANGRRSMVVDLSRTDPDGWDADRRPTTPISSDVIWETHIGDFSNAQSSGVPVEHRGKYLAFTDSGTTLNGEGAFPTCVEYLKNLGITVVQLLPFYDYGSVDETRTGGYNWGYDPVNYNVPEGPYSTNPYDGAVRIRECKAMVQALHAAGITVVMDVVYNPCTPPTIGSSVWFPAISAGVRTTAHSRTVRVAAAIWPPSMRCSAGSWSNR